MTSSRVSSDSSDGQGPLPCDGLPPAIPQSACLIALLPSWPLYLRDYNAAKIARNPLGPISCQTIGRQRSHVIDKHAQHNIRRADRFPRVRRYIEFIRLCGRGCGDLGNAVCRAPRGAFGVHSSPSQPCSIQHQQKEDPPSTGTIGLVDRVAKARPPKCNMGHQMPVAKKRDRHVVAMRLPLRRLTAASWSLSFNTRRTSRFMHISDVCRCAWR